MCASSAGPTAYGYDRVAWASGPSSSASRCRQRSSGTQESANVRRVGVVGAVTVSGLPQLDDHAFLVSQLTVFLANRTPSQ